MADSDKLFHDLYSEHHGWLFGWLRKKLGCSHNAADVAQDTFLRILNSRDALLAGPSRGYLVTTARNLIIDRARRQRIERLYLEELAHLSEGASYPSPERLLASLEALEQISVALAGLSEKPRRAFLLHYLDGQPQGQVAEALGVSVRMVQKYLVQVLLHCQALRDRP